MSLRDNEEVRKMKTLHLRGVLSLNEIKVKIMKGSGLLVLLIVIGTFYFASGQNARLRPTRNSWSLGYGLINEALPEGNAYKPSTILGNYPLWSIKRLTIYAEGQFVEAFSVARWTTDFEFGLNVGFSYTFLQTRKVSLHVALGSGPHYITIETEKQARGFIFSDNLELGAAYRIESLNTSVLFKLRYRHISNAGLQEPNGGIDNLFIVAGITGYI